MRTMMNNMILILLLAFMSSCNEGKSIEQEPILFFVKEKEPIEHSCSFLKPQDWIIEGGMSRKDTTVEGQPDKASTPVFRMELISPEKDAAIYWFPEINYFDMNRCPTRDFLENIFPEGSMYNGMKVLPLLSPEDYVVSQVIPEEHPGACNIRVIDKKYLEIVDIKYAEYLRELMSDNTISHRSAVITTEFTLNDKVFVEKTACTIEDYGPMGGGMWRNSNTFSIRSTKEGYLENMAILGTITLSFCIDDNWIKQEFEKSQMFIKTNIKNISNQQVFRKQIHELRTFVKQQISEAMFSGFLVSFEGTNPFNDRKVLTHDYWAHYWINKEGNMVCTQNTEFDPGKTYKRIQIKQY